ncbi:MAG: hypothetical protein AAGE84_04515 [Cyanobacteria bacterium P01_G01_bin.39]
MSQLAVLDFTGQVIKSKKSSAPRIVCLSAAGLDILVELGLEPVGYISSIAGNAECYGDLVKSFTNVGSWMFPNCNAIKNLQKMKAHIIHAWSEKAENQLYFLKYPTSFPDTSLYPQ